MLDQMDDDRFAAMQKQWRRSPPAHWLIAAFMKYKGPDDPAAPAPSASIAALRAAFPGGRL